MEQSDTNLILAGVLCGAILLGIIVVANWCFKSLKREKRDWVSETSGFARDNSDKSNKLNNSDKTDKTENSEKFELDIESGQEEANQGNETWMPPPRVQARARARESYFAGGRHQELHSPNISPKDGIFEAETPVEKKIFVETGNTRYSMKPISSALDDNQQSQNRISPRTNSRFSVINSTSPKTKASSPLTSPATTRPALPARDLFRKRTSSLDPGIAQAQGQDKSNPNATKAKHRGEAPQYSASKSNVKSQATHTQATRPNGKAIKPKETQLQRKLQNSGASNLPNRKSSRPINPRYTSILDPSSISGIAQSSNSNSNSNSNQNTNYNSTTNLKVRKDSGTSHPSPKLENYSKATSVATASKNVEPVNNRRSLLKTVHKPTVQKPAAKTRRISAISPPSQAPLPNQKARHSVLVSGKSAYRPAIALPPRNRNSTVGVGSNGNGNARKTTYTLLHKAAINSSNQAQAGNSAKRESRSLSAVAVAAENKAGVPEKGTPVPEKGTPVPVRKTTIDTEEFRELVSAAFSLSESLARNTTVSTFLGPDETPSSPVSEISFTESISYYSEISPEDKSESKKVSFDV